MARIGLLAMGITITVKLFASLGPLLPAGSERNVATLVVPDGATPLQVVQQLRVPPRLCFLCMINGLHVPHKEWGTRSLKHGDTLAMWPPVAGG